VCVLFSGARERKALLFVCICAPNHRILFFSYLRTRQRASQHENTKKRASQQGSTTRKNWWRAFFDELRATSETLLFLVHVLSGEKMAQRSPRKSLQLNRANTPINFNGPMQDVNVSGSFFIKKERAGSKTCARALFVKSLSFTLAVKNLAFSPRVKTSRY